MVVDVLAARAGAPRGREVSGAWVSDACLGGEPVVLVKPLTFMNRSGGPIFGVLRAYDAAPQDLIIVMDEVALPLGELRIRERGSHGGHNGLRSVIDVLGTEDIPRLRIGIGKEDAPQDLADYVLSDFTEDDVLAVQDIVGWAGDAVECFIREGAASAMNRFNRIPRQG